MDWVLNLRGISPTWKLVLCVLGDHADQKGVVWRGMDDVAEESCLSRRAVAAALSKMEKAGLIKSAKKRGEEGRQAANVYTLSVPEKEMIQSAPGACWNEVSRVHDVHAGNGFQSASDDSPECTTCTLEQDPLLISVKHLKPSLVRESESKDIETAKWLLTKVLALFPNIKPPKIEAWARHIRLMHEQDGRTYAQIGELFEWANKDEFWQQNIRSPEKLRAKWDDLWIRMTRAKGTAKARRELADTAQPAAPSDRQLCSFPDSPCPKPWTTKLGTKGDDPGYCIDHGEIMRDRQSSPVGRGAGK